MGQIITYTSDKLQRGELQVTRLIWQVTAAATLKDYNANAAVAGFGQFITQTQADAFLGATNDVIVGTGFGSTAMGDDAVGILVNMGGQMASLNSVTVKFKTTTTAALDTVVERTLWTDATALPDTLTNNVQVTGAGNIVLHAVGPTDFDSATEGAVELIIRWTVK